MCSKSSLFAMQMTSPTAKRLSRKNLGSRHLWLSQSKRSSNKIFPINKKFKKNYLIWKSVCSGTTLNIIAVLSLSSMGNSLMHSVPGKLLWKKITRFLKIKKERLVWLEDSFSWYPREVSLRLMKSYILSKIKMRKNSLNDEWLRLFWANDIISSFFYIHKLTLDKFRTFYVNILIVCLCVW